MTTVPDPTLKELIQSVARIEGMMGYLRDEMIEARSMRYDGNRQIGELEKRVEHLEENVPTIIRNQLHNAATDGALQKAMEGYSQKRANRALGVSIATSIVATIGLLYTIISDFGSAGGM